MKITHEHKRILLIVIGTIVIRDLVFLLVPSLSVSGPLGYLIGFAAYVIIGLLLMKAFPSKK